MPNEDPARTTPPRIAVGSTNWAKLDAVEEAFTRALGHVLVEGVPITGAPDQPRSDDETRRGAEYRARAVREAQPQADYWVGLEGGVDTVDGATMVMAWVVIDTTTQSGRSRSATYQLPPAAAAILAEGGSLGDVSAAVEGDDWRTRGLVARLSGGHITRGSLYVQPVSLALFPFLRPWREVQDSLASGFHVAR
jgi:inosine/xanthosine triphosphatase